MRLFQFRVRIALACILASGCSSHVDPQIAASVAAHDAALREMPRDFYTPGLGDLMNSLQLRHAKLWFAGRAENWELAAFESHEIHENLQRIARWHADNDALPMAPSIKAYMNTSQYALDQSIVQRNPKAFEAAFDQLTESCNRCHRAAKHEFIVIGRPKADPVGNQEWRAAH